MFIKIFSSVLQILYILADFFFGLFDFSKVERGMLKSLTMMVDLLLYPCSSNKINFICFKAILLVTVYLELLHLFGKLN